MSSETTQTPPAPLGWCSWHLDDGEFVQGATIQSGTVLCVECCKQHHANGREMQEQMEARQQETFDRLSGFRRPPGF